MDTTKPPLTDLIRLACRWEATARKAGNVHPERAFADLTVDDFYRSADAIAPILGEAPNHPVGVTVLAAIQATRRAVASNTNLGIVLLLAPLAKVVPTKALRDGIEDVLASLTVEDSRNVYAAIRLAQAGGIGEVGEQDVRSEPTLPLRAAMALAQDRDLIARQYVDGFAEVFSDGVPALHEGIKRWNAIENAIVFCHLTLIARHPDSLIARKRGLSEAYEASRRALAVLNADWPTASSGRREFADFDAWLRAEWNGRNPGTSADLVTASLFAALREGIITLRESAPRP